MGKIHQLPDDLANKIAAGEVVERPASVVKELLENSIDANSHRIDLYLEEGGLKLIRVVDDGEGMSKEDAVLSLERHATSKIKSVHDLFRIESLGFRGEAIPSIASVSEFECKTSTGDGVGTHILIEGGKNKQIQPHHSRKGTEMIVKNLFFNTPARLKYLKSIQTELGNIMENVQRLALSHPEVAFSVFHNERKIFQTTGNGNIHQVLAGIYGRETAVQMLEIQEESMDFQVTGYLGKPSISRSTRNAMHISINGRMIRNSAISRAILAGYHTQLMIGRFPIICLNIEVDPILVDVNVHPTKMEVRLSKEQELCEWLTDVFFKALNRQVHIPKAVIKTVEPKTTPEKTTQSQFEFTHQLDETPSTVESNTASRYEPKFSSRIEDEPIKVKEEYEPEEFVVDEGKEAISTPDLPTMKQEERLKPMYPIGQVHGTYIVAQNEDGAYFIDQHAAQERINYDYFLNKLSYEKDHLQQLLVPLTIEVTRSEKLVLEDAKQVFENMGIHLEDFGELTYIVRSHPTWFPKGEEQQLIEEMISFYLLNKNIDKKAFREEAITMMSCKASIKANHFLSKEEMFALLEDLRKSASPFTCPHGRPILVEFSKNDIEKMFKRIQ